MSTESERLEAQVVALEEQLSEAQRELLELERRRDSLSTPSSAAAVAELKELARDTGIQRDVIGTIEKALEATRHRLEVARQAEKREAIAGLLSGYNEALHGELLPKLEAVQGALGELDSIAREIVTLGGRSPIVMPSLKRELKNTIAAIKGQNGRGVKPDERAILEESLRRTESRLVKGASDEEVGNLRLTAQRLRDRLEALP